MRNQFILIILTFWAGAAMAVQEPDYQLVKQEPPFELRTYEKFVVAETLVQGDFDSAGRQGFRRVAGYIFGGNRGADGASKKIAMTAPVTVEPMIGGWKLWFVMPKEYGLQDLPAPESAEVNLREVPAHRVAAIRFSGFTTAASIQENTERLQQWMSAQGLAPLGPPQVARYNDPFTLPWNRRNEILIPVQ